MAADASSSRTLSGESRLPANTPALDPSIATTWYRKRRLSGRNCGQAYQASVPPCSTRVIGRTGPPESDTAYSPRMESANRITPRVPQLPPAGVPLRLAITRVGPPDTSIAISVPLAKNASVRPSGDQNGFDAAVVPGRGYGSFEASGLIQSALRPDCVSRATKARCRPDGETTPSDTSDVPACRCSCRAGPIIRAFAGFAFRSLSSPGHPFLCQAWPSPFECTCAPLLCVPSPHRCGLVRYNA